MERVRRKQIEEPEDTEPPLWKLKPKRYATLQQVIANLELRFLPIDPNGDIALCVEKLKVLAKRAEVKWGLNKGNEDD